MSKPRITRWLTVILLAAAGLIWAVQDGCTASLPGTAAVAMADGTAIQQNTQSVVGEDTDSGGRRLRELTGGLGGFRIPCMGCHNKHLGAPPEGHDPVGRGKGPHTPIVLQHGENNRCFNCHHPSHDRYGFFVAHDGSEIPIETVELLCAKCHGPHYRDWKNGSHGLRTGHWNLAVGPRATARCTACHDPHQPYYKPIPTLPGPRSRRGEPLPDHPCVKGH